MCSICSSNNDEDLINDFEDLNTSISNNELDLAKELKSLCELYKDKTDRWKEKEPQESAKIFHQLGILYKNKCLDHGQASLPNKRKYIQSAALLNCALDRQPLSKEIGEDLQKLCADLLKNSKAQLQHFGLVEFTRNLKKEIDQWRNDLKKRATVLLPIVDEVVENDLKQFECQKINTVESLQNEIAEKYKYFMKEISRVTVEVLGHNPCDFSLIGLGSMTRREITPFSDFESLILLKDTKCCYCKELEYFRWYAVVFQVIVINLGETPLHCVAIPSLNDSNTDLGNWFFDAVTKRGISFDSMMPYACKNPLGRPPTKSKPFTTELIKPVSEMVKYLEQEHDEKNGYQLSDILTYTCLITGSEDVYSDFEVKREDVLRVAKAYKKKEVKDMIKKDMEIHSTKLGISSTIENDSYNVKKLAYRSTTIFITGIAKWYNIKPGSCFEVVRKMEDIGLIFGDDFSRKLQYAVALACEIRLKTYLEHNCQWDYANLSEEETDEELLTSLISAVGKRSCYDYLEIACCLQYDAITHFQLDRSYLFYNCITMYIAISSLLRMYDRLNVAKAYINRRPVLPHQPADNYNVIDYDREVLEDLSWSQNSFAQGEDYGSSNSNIFKQTDGHISINTSKSSNIRLGNWHNEMQKLNQKLASSECFSPELDEPHSTFKNLDEQLTNILLRIADDLFKTGVYFEAEYCYKAALKSLQNNTDSSKKWIKAKCFYWIGMCLSRTRNYDCALDKFFEALSEGESQKEMEHFKGDCNLQIGLCQRHLSKPEEALKRFESALRICSSDDAKKSENVAFCMVNIGICLCNMSKYEDALKQFEKLLKFCVLDCNVSPTSKANFLYNLGFCLQNLNQYDEAQEKLLEAVQIYRYDLDHEERNDADRAKTHIHIGNCFKVMNNHETALDNYLESLNLWKKLHQLYPGDHMGYLQYSKAMAYKRIGSCYLKYNFCEKAVKNFKESLQTFQKLCHRRKNLTSNLYDLRRSLSGAYRGVGDFESACMCYRECLAMTNKTTPKKQIADLHRQIGDCLKQMKEPHEESSEKALEIYKELIENEEKDKQPLRKCIGLSYWSLNNTVSARDKFREFINVSKRSNSSLLLLIDRVEIARVLIFIGKLWNSDGNKDAAKRAFEDSLKRFLALPVSLEYEHTIAYLYNQIGICWLSSAREAPPDSVKEFKSISKSNFEKAKSRQNMLLLTSKGKMELARTYKNLGEVLSLPPQYKNFGKVIYEKETQQYRDAITYYGKAKKLYEEMGFKKFAQDIADLFKNLGTCFKTLKNWEEAIKNFQDAADVYKSIPKSGAEVSNNIPFVKKNVGLCYQNLELHEEAIASFKESLEAYSEVSDISSHCLDKAFINEMIAKSYEALTQRQAAMPYYKKSLSIHESMPVEEQNQKQIAFLKSKLTPLDYKSKHGRRRHQHNYEEK